MPGSSPRAIRAPQRAEAAPVRSYRVADRLNERMLERLARGESAVVRLDRLDYRDKARARAAHVPAARSWPHEPASLASGQRLGLEARWLLPLVVPLGHAVRLGMVLLLAMVVVRPIGEHTVDLLGTVSQALHQVVSHTHP